MEDDDGCIIYVGTFTPEGKKIEDKYVKGECPVCMEENERLCTPECPCKLRICEGCLFKCKECPQCRTALNMKFPDISPELIKFLFD